VRRRRVSPRRNRRFPLSRLPSGVLYVWWVYLSLKQIVKLFLVSVH
jgi:hypothetical protein